MVGDPGEGQAVGDGDDEAAGRVAQPLHQARLGGRVERGGGLVEDEDAPVLGQAPGDGDPLPLPPGQLRPAVARGAVQREGGVVADAADARRGLDGPAGRGRVVGLLGQAQGDVLAHGGGQQYGVLGHERDAGEALGAVAGDAVELDRAPLGGQEADERESEGGLARSGGTDDDGQPGAEGEVDSAQGGLPGPRVAGAQSPHRDVRGPVGPASPAGGEGGAASLRPVPIEEVHDARPGEGGEVAGVPQGGEVPQWAHELGREQDEGEDLQGAQLVAPQGHHDQDEDWHRREGEAGQAGLDQGHAQLAHGPFQETAGGPGELGLAAPVRAEGDEGGHAPHGVDELGVELLVGVPVVGPPGGERPVPESGQCGHQEGGRNGDAPGHGIDGGHCGAHRGDDDGGHADLREVPRQVGVEVLDAVNDDGVVPARAPRRGVEGAARNECSQRPGPQGRLDGAHGVLGEELAHQDQEGAGQEDAGERGGRCEQVGVPEGRPADQGGEHARGEQGLARPGGGDGDAGEDEGGERAAVALPEPEQAQVLHGTTP